MTANATLVLLSLQRQLAGVDPRVLLVRRPVVNRVARQLWPGSSFSWQAPHAFAVACDRDKLLEIVEPDEIGIASAAALDATVLLLPRPRDELLTALSDAELLHDYARRLFHLRVEELLAGRWPSEAAGCARAQERRWALGFPCLAEIERVLRQEARLRPPGDVATVYQEFVATFLEFYHFQPTALATWFPGLPSHDDVLTLIRQDVADTELAEILALRILPVAKTATTPEREKARRPDSEADLHLPVEDAARSRQVERWLERASLARAQGNLVRAALLTQRCRRADPSRDALLRQQVEADLTRLVERLVAALKLPAEQVPDWLEALREVVGPAARYRGDWPREARLLYDLQKVVVDLSREPEVIEVVPWVRFLGKLPLRRKLPLVPLVQAVQHLQRAQKRLSATRLPAPVGQRLDDLIERARLAQTQQVHERLLPILHGTLDEVGLRPANLPEALARDKLADELLGTLCRRGYLQIGDLRDALSRNQLKMPDLASPLEFWRGDALLRADRLLMVRLDGLYQGGAAYHRWFHRASSIFFGTRTGRWLTLYLLLPFLAAFVILEGLQHSVGVALQAMHLPVTFATVWSVPILAAYLLGLIHYAAVRRESRRVWRLFVTGMRKLVVEVPRWLRRWQPVRLLLESWPWQWFHRHLLSPTLVGLLGGGLSALWLPPWGAWGIGLVLFVFLTWLEHTRLGRSWAAWVTDQVSLLLRRFSLDLIPALLRWILDWFKRIVEQIERGLYAVDERLRFQASDNRLTIVSKATFGIFWYLATYLFRFALNLLVEPQVNPIKHFPVVTVAHKLLLPTIPHLAHLVSTLMPEHAALANTLATGFVFGIPGVFGYLAWELKENWRLYAGNRPPTLGPVIIGSHGETLRRLLRPGFHSGTIPKAWSGRRRADKLAARRRHHAPTRLKALHQLHHAEEDLHHFVEHELLAWLIARGDGPKLHCGGLDLTPNRVTVRLVDHDSVVLLTFLEQAGKIVLLAADRPWRDRLGPAQLQVWELALCGFAQRAGVDVWPTDPSCLPWPVQAGIEVWPRDATQATELRPWPDDLAPPPPIPFPAAWDCQAHPMPWRDWVERWEQLRDPCSGAAACQ